MIISLIGCGKSEETMKDEIYELIIMQDFDEARSKVAEYFGDDRSEAVSWLMLISEMEGELYSDKLVIQDGWTWKVDGNYTYINGRVKNNGDKPIRYFKITAQYLNEYDNVLDTDYTNSTETVRPGDSKEFEIMHRDNDEYKKTRIFVEEVNIE